MIGSFASKVCCVFIPLTFSDSMLISVCVVCCVVESVLVVLAIRKKKGKLIQKSLCVCCCSVFKLWIYIFISKKISI